MRMKISATGREADGFTLIEILVVMAILAILAGAIVSRMSQSLQGRELREAAAGLVHTMRTAHTLAMARKTMYAVEIDPARGGWTVMSLSADNNEMTPVRASWLKNGHWAKGINMVEFRTLEGGQAANGREIRFLPDGTSNGAKLRFQSESRTITVMVYPHNGRVEYAEGGNERFFEDQYELGD